MSNLTGELFAALQRITPQHALSRLGGKLAKAETPWLKDQLIRQFCRSYKIDLEEAAEQELSAYPSFNDFFTRALKPGARPVNADQNSIVCPADGTVSQIGQIDGGQLIQAKGKQFSVTALLGGDDADSDRFSNGSFTTIYLSPQDYHRVHMPIDGNLDYCRYIPGKLFSVNNITTQHVDAVFAKNERLVCVFDTPIGRCAVILVGAMMVAGIESVWHGDYQPGTRIDTYHQSNGEKVELKKGDEMGRFKFGSTVIMLFEPNKVEWRSEYSAGSTTRMGAALADISIAESALS